MTVALIMSMIAQVDTVHVHLDHTPASRIVRVALQEAGLQDGRLELDEKTRIVVSDYRDITWRWPDGPLVSQSKYAEPHRLCFWEQVTCCELCLLRQRQHVVEHLRFKANVWREMRRERPELTEQWSTWWHPGEGSLTVYLIAPRWQTWPPLRPSCQIRYVSPGVTWGTVQCHTERRRLEREMQERAWK